MEPLLFLGDVMFLHVVEQMALSQPAIITIGEDEKPLPRIVTIPETGRQVLAGQIDYLSLHPPQRWVGGVPADGRWRWDATADGIARAG